jgi:hypothetical protein
MISTVSTVYSSSESHPRNTSRPSSNQPTLEPFMSHLLRWPSSSATSDDGRPCDSSLSDDKCEKTFPSPAASSVASSATHLPEAVIKNQTVTYFVGDESVKGLDGLPCSRPLTTVRVLVAHIGYATHFPNG